MINIKITNTPEIQYTDLIQAFAAEKDMLWNDACEQIVEEFIGHIDIEMVNDLIGDSMYEEGYRFLKQVMEENNLQEVRIV